MLFWATVTVPEPRQPRRPHDCTEEADGALHTQQSVQVTKGVSWRTARMKHPVGTTAGSRTSRGPAVDTLSATCMSLVELQSSRFRSSCCSAHRVASSLQASRIVLQPGECRRCGATCLSLFILCGVSSLDHENCCKIPVSVMATTVTCRNASTSSCLCPPRFCLIWLIQKIALHITVRVCKYRIPTKMHECSAFGTWQM